MHEENDFEELDELDEEADSPTLKESEPEDSWVDDVPIDELSECETGSDADLNDDTLLDENDPDFSAADDDDVDSEWEEEELAAEEEFFRQWGDLDDDD